MIRTRLLFACAFAALACGAFAAPVRLVIPWERSWPVVSPATAGQFGFELSNESQESVQLQFIARLTSPSGVGEKIEEDVLLKSGETRKISWPLTGKEFGVWTVDYALSQQADPASNLKRRIDFGYLEPAGPTASAPAFKFGVVAHTGRLAKSERDRELEAAAYAGSKVMRTGSGWETVQPDRGQWKWDTMDQMVEKAASLGMEMQVLLAYTPRWAAPLEAQHSKDWLDWNRASPDLAGWREFVAAYAQRYKGRIHLWETWNEPDLEGFWRGTTEQYMEMFKVSREELKKADPSNTVMSGGFATLQDHPSRKRNPDLQARVMKALSTQMDVHAVHEHGPFDRFAQVVDGPYASLRAALPQPAPPLFFNETAEHSMNGTEKQQAMILVKKAVFARARGAVGYLWYDLRNDGTDAGDPEHNFGLLTKALEPKPAYIAFNTVAREVVPRPYLRQLDAGENRWFFLHGDEKEKLLVYWNEDGGTQNEQVLLRVTGARRVRSMDINGNAAPLPLDGDLVVVNSNKEPRLLLAEGATDIEFAGRLAGPTKAFFGGPGNAVEVHCEFSNPTAKPVTVKTVWTLPSMMRLVTPAPDSLEIPPNARGVSALTVRLPEGDAYVFGRNGKLKVAFEFDGLPYRGSLLVPVHFGTIAVKGDGGAGVPDIVLDQREQLTSFIDADPHMTPFLWKGPEDLSAKVWFKVERDDLVLRVVVTDNKHVQPGPAADMWMADSVQCVLALPGQKGSWELGFADTGDGRPLAAVWAVPSGREDCREKIRVEVERAGEGRIYTARLPRKELGLSDQVLREGFRFNLAVNDNDGPARSHAMQIAAGIVANKTTDSAPYLVFTKLPSEKP